MTTNCKVHYDRKARSVTENLVYGSHELSSIQAFHLEKAIFL